MRQEPEYRNAEAFDFVFAQLSEAARAVGANAAAIDQSVIVERAVVAGISRRDIEVATTLLGLTNQIIIQDGRLRHNSGRSSPSRSSQPWPSLPQAMNSARRGARTQAYEIVRDIVERRADGRPKHAEPLDAFVEALGHLGYGHLRLWWMQVVSELRQTDPQLSPISVLVLAAALVEGALAFVVKHARARDLAVFQSKDFDGEPRSWRIDKLVTSAASGGDEAILDPATRHRADQLVLTRQRIHAGRMLSDFPRGLPDLRPEEAREARAVAEQVVRCVLDWLERFPHP